ncbi:DNA (cytosine-5-)-methyltransferase [Ornithinimicrobium sp. LYQ92]|uniref:DNA (cytosine-5-)-methyltransferase n=1 Tax=Serinicoccus sp. LYQ92 TaxID=3378798 RepID=UPI0038520472
MFEQQPLAPFRPETVKRVMPGPSPDRDTLWDVSPSNRDDEVAFTFSDLFAGIGGFHSVLSDAGGRCVFVSEIDREARTTYLRNWPAYGEGYHLNEDINEATPETGQVALPEHDVLAAGFPCQPFSKSGRQRGMDEVRGTLFWNIARALQARRPSIILLENVRNLAGPRHQHEWRMIIRTLRELGYRVSSTPTVFSPHFLPPSLGGTPQVRDRVFILGTYVGPERALAETDAPPTVIRGPVDGWDPMWWKVGWILDADSTVDATTYGLSRDETKWIDTWDDFVVRHRVATGERLPGHPLWFDEWGSEDRYTPGALAAMPAWKVDFINKNRTFYRKHQDLIEEWIRDRPEIRGFPESRRKLEWQAQDTPRLWNTLMHLRPSGIRAKAPTYLPALVAITQTSIVGPRRRRLTPHEAARAQGLPRSFSFAGQRDSASYKQVGNGVATGAAWYVLRQHVLQDTANAADIPPALREAILGAPASPTGDALSPEAHLFEATWRQAQGQSASRLAS